ncbi:MAG: 5'-methylthioadenosine/S-adenosylhomocysteine nucleosidase, partial [Acidobacteriota bacterium]
MKSLPALLLLLPSLLSAERPLAVQGAVDSELQPLLEALGRPPAREIDGYSFWEGRLEGRRVVVSRTEVGMVHAAVATTLLIREYAPELIINQGTAGAVNPDLQVGDIVIGTASVPFGAFRTRARPLGAGVDLDGWSPMPRRLRIGGERVAMERFPSDVDWVERVAKTAHPGGRVLRGVVGSADQWNRE